MGNIIQLSIPGMKCGGCVAAIEKALINKAEGVIKVGCDLETKSIRIEADVSAAAVIEALKLAGYETHEITNDEPAP